MYKEKREETMINSLKKCFLPILLGLLIYIPVGIIWRSELTGQSDTLDIILGSLPNFIGAGLVVPFVLYVFASIFKLDRYRCTSLRVVGISVSFFLIWEFRQITGSSFFDWYDVVATLLGGMVAYAILKSELKESIA